MTVMEFAWKAYFSMPPTVRQKLRIVLKGAAGHRSSLFNTMIATRDARGKCRIDRCARAFCDYLTASGIDGVEGKRCLEIGTGYVGSSAVVMWLLGACAVTSVDLNRLLVSDALKESILPVEKTELFGVLKKHVKSEEALSDRIRQVYTWADSGQGNLPDWFGYWAPFDLLSSALPDAVDFVYSTSTLEHLPRSIVGRFAERMASILADGGTGLHFIDLTDHFDSQANPFGFLSLADEDYSDDLEADSRGNRVRGSEWLEIFRKAGFAAEIVQSDNAPPSQLPAIVASPFHAMSAQELLRTSVLICLHKKPGIA
jgi:hypothetical protein